LKNIQPLLQFIPNNLLIAQNVAKEAQMIAEAGQLGAVTVSTSMAGRGIDDQSVHAIVGQPCYSPYVH
jgi:preprotein translocase subunit SecA